MESFDQQHKTPEQRRRQSLAILKEVGIEPMEGLPCIEAVEDVVIRTKEEVTQRVLGLLLVAAYADRLCSGDTRDASRAWLEQLIQAYGAQDFFSPRERAFLDNDHPTDEENYHFMWMFEPLAVLEWALGLLSVEEALAVPATFCDVTRVVTAVNSFRSLAEVLETATLRDPEAILDQADLIYRYDWVCVEDRIHHPQNEDPAWGIVMERHRALNWLINYGYETPDDWDDVGTDT
jgi:hypothetical protein